MSVQERIATAMEEIAAFDFDKSGTVSGQGGGYKFIPIATILSAVRRAHAKAGVFMTTGPLEYDEDKGEQRWDYTKENKYGDKTVWHAAIGHCEVTIHGADGDSITFTVPFEAQDNSDKLSNKIITNIERSAYRILYAIDEGNAEDPESTNEPLGAVPTKAQKLVQADAFFKTPSKNESNKDRAKRILPKLIEWAEKNEGNPTLDTLRNFYGKDIEGWDDKTIIDGWATLVEKEGAE